MIAAKKLALYALLGASILVALYAVAVFFVLPSFFGSGVAAELSRSTGRKVTIGAIRLDFFNLSIHGRDFKIQEATSGEFFTCEKFEAEFLLWSSLIHRTWTLKEALLDSPRLILIRGADGQMNFRDLLLLKIITPPKFRLGLLRIKEGRLTMVDHLVPAAYSTNILTFSAQMVDFAMDASNNVTYAFSGLTAEGEKLSLSGAFHLDPFASTGGISVEDVRLAQYRPYVEKGLDAVMEGGWLTAHARYDVDLSLGRPRTRLLDGTILVNDLSVSESGSRRPLLGLKALTLYGIEIDFIGQHLAARSVGATGAWIKMRRLPDGSFNLQRLARSAPGPAAAGANLSFSIGEIRLQDSRVELDRLYGTENLHWRDLRVAWPCFTLNPPSLSVSALALWDGNLRFTDLSQSNDVRMSLTKMNIRIGAFSSETPALAGLSVDGKINQTAGMQLSGEFHPIHPEKSLSFRGLIQNVDLVPLNPYVTRILGYELSEGRLSLDIHCRVENGRLHAQSRVEIDGAKLGARTPHPDAIKVPIPLAILLLRDGDGKITINVPFEGSLEDPAFDLPKALVEAIFLPIVKTAAYPFAVLTRRSGESSVGLDFQVFHAGSSKLGDAGIVKLALIGEGLRRLPDLLLDIEGSVENLVESGDPKRLAADRARSVKDHLTRREGVEPGRIFLIENIAAEVPMKGSRAFLTLKETQRAPGAGALGPAPLPSLTSIP